jgi:hypothetical protein
VRSRRHQKIARDASLWGEPSLAWFAVLALMAMALFLRIGSKQRAISAAFMGAETHFVTRDLTKLPNVQCWFTPVRD